MKYLMIDRCRTAYPVRMMCRCLSVSPSGYYDWSRRKPSNRDMVNAALVEQIKNIHQESDGVFGYPRIWDELRYDGQEVGRNRVARLMRINNIQGIPQSRRWRKKSSGDRPNAVRNHLDRNFQSDTPNTKWVTDITYIRTGEGWLYLAVVIDLFTRKVVGWSMSHTQDHQLVLQAVLMAVWQRTDRSTVLLHSDRGTQFTSAEYQTFLSDHGIVCSMSAVGSCADNAVAESFFGVLKRERVNRRKYTTRAEARNDVFDYIERFYNPAKQRKIDRSDSSELLLTQPSVKTG